MSYDASTMGYKFGAYSGSPTFAVLFLAGQSVVSPIGSNLVAPTQVGKYGATSWSSSPFKQIAKAFPVRFGKNLGWVTISGITRPAGAGSVGPSLPAYGN